MISPAGKVKTLRAKLEKAAVAGGVRAVGVADLDAAAQKYPHLFDRIGARFPRAVAMAIPVPPASLESIIDRPTPLYFHAYRQVNYRLDDAAFTVAGILADAGYAALPIAASQMISHHPPLGHISHRAVAVAAGLGWIGRSGLLVTPKYGSRVRLVTVLTDAPLAAGGEMAFSCGSCVECVKACPAGALGAKPEDYSLDACYAKLTEFTRIAYVGQHICGVCVKACSPDNALRGVDRRGRSRRA